MPYLERECDCFLNKKKLGFVLHKYVYAKESEPFICLNLMDTI